MLTVVWSPKGGAGTSVVAAAAALARAAALSPGPVPPSVPPHVPQSAAATAAGELAARSVLLVDLGDDQPSVLGTARPSGPGVRQWMAGAAPEPAALARLAVGVEPSLRLLPAGPPAVPAPAAGTALAAALRTGAHEEVVVDLGVVRPEDTTPSGTAADELLDAADRSVMVVRPCYLALRAAVAVGHRPDLLVVVEEPGRALVARDVADVLGVEVAAVVPLDPAIGRAVDAGVLARRRPAALADPLEALW